MITAANSRVSRIALTLALLSTAQVGCGGSAMKTPARSGESSGGGYSGSAEASPATASADSAGGDSSGATYGSAPSDASKPSSEGSYAPPPMAAPGGGYAPSATPAPAAKPAPAGASGAPTTPITIETKTTVTVMPPTPFPPSGGYEQESPTSGVLTAAIWDDNAYRTPFLSFLSRYPQHHNAWGVDMPRRVTIRVEDSNGVAVADAPIALRTPDGSIVNLRAHGDGTALYWPSPSALSYNSQQQGSIFSVAAQSGTLRTETTFAAPSSDSTWTVKLKGVPFRAQAPALDLAFVVDCTGSMGDEISYLQNELAGVVKRAKAEHATRRVRLGLVLYRDRGDDFVTKSYPFTEDLGTYLGYLKNAQAMGGGDMPESVNQALSDTVSKLSWAGDESGRLAILVADASPHYYADEQYTYKNAMVDFAARGVKLVTVGASGIDKSTEYLFRQMSAFTGGRYVFLTDDSGVGDSHITPDITGYQVEHLDKILVRVISDEVKSFKR